LQKVACAWDAAWRACLPGSDPARAITLAAPLADLGDPAAMIRRALRSAAAADLGLR